MSPIRNPRPHSTVRMHTRACERERDSRIKRDPAALVDVVGITDPIRRAKSGPTRALCRLGRPSPRSVHTLCVACVACDACDAPLSSHAVDRALSGGERSPTDRSGPPAASGPFVSLMRLGRPGGGCPQPMPPALRSRPPVRCPASAAAHPGGRLAGSVLLPYCTACIASIRLFHVGRARIRVRLWQLGAAAGVAVREAQPRLLHAAPPPRMSVLIGSLTSETRCTRRSFPRRSRSRCRGRRPPHCPRRCCRR